MTKKLNTDLIKTELEGSAFFPKRELVPTQNTEPNARTVKPNGAAERVKASNNKPVSVDGDLQADDGSILSEIRIGKKPESRRVKRFSFEIYEDQIPAIEELQFRYKRKTGNRLSTSRFIREAIEQYLLNLREI